MKKNKKSYDNNEYSLTMLNILCIIIVKVFTIFLKGGVINGKGTIGIWHTRYSSRRKS